MHFRRGQRSLNAVSSFTSCSFTQAYVFGPDALVVEIGLIPGADDCLPKYIRVGGWHGSQFVEIKEEFVDL